MEAPFLLIPFLAAILYFTGQTHTQNISAENATAFNDTVSVNDTESGNSTRERPYDKFRTIEMIREQVLERTTLNTVCPPNKPKEGDEIIITDMTVGSRQDSKDRNFEYARVGINKTFGNPEDIISELKVSTINECVEKCTSTPECLAYAHEDLKHACKLAKNCKPSLEDDEASQVFTMSYWYTQPA